MGAEPSPEPEFVILLVCTGNICRSALAERLGRAHLAQAPRGRAGGVRLVSAGTRAVVGSAMHPDSERVLRDLGGDASGFCARQFVEAYAREADLILTMTRDHRREVLTALPRGLARTFTLREAADLARSVPGAAHLPGPTAAERARSLVGAMSAQRAHRRSRETDDIPDPIGSPPAVHRHVGGLIADSLLPLLSTVAGRDL